MEIRVVHNAGHYEVYVDGDFICSADSYSEASDEIKKYLENRRAESVVMD